MHRLVKAMRPLAAIATVAIAAGFLALSADASATEGEAAFKARCAECHGPRDIAYWGRQRPDAAARRAWMDKFLHKHYPPPEAERALIVDHIEAMLAK